MSFRQNWAAYRNGLGAPTGNDNYWLGLDKVYRLVQMGDTRLRVEVWIRRRRMRCLETEAETYRCHLFYICALESSFSSLTLLVGSFDP